MTTPVKLWRTLLVSASTLMLASAPLAGAQAADTYPDHAVTVTVPYDPGGGSDVMARMVEKYWKDAFKVPLKFQYRAGAGGTVGMTTFANAAAKDGYDIATFNFPHIVVHPAAGLAQYDPIDDFTYICQIATDYSVAVVPAKSPYKSMKDFVEAAKANPGKLSISIPQAMDTGHIAYAQLVNDTGIDTSLVKYQTGAEQLSGILGGDVDVAFGTTGTMTSSIDAGELRVLAVTSPERLKTKPDWPTFQEQDLDVEIALGRIWLLPKDVDPSIQQTLEAGFKKISEDPEFEKQMNNLGYEVTFMTGAETRQVVKDFADTADELVTQMRAQEKN